VAYTHEAEAAEGCADCTEYVDDDDDATPTRHSFVTLLLSNAKKNFVESSRKNRMRILKNYEIRPGLGIVGIPIFIYFYYILLYFYYPKTQK